MNDLSSPLSNEPEACWEIFSNTPTAASVGTRDEPPYEMKGRGIPFVGTSDRTTLILKSACVTIPATKPKANNIPNRSGASNDVRSPRQRKRAKTAITANASATAGLQGAEAGVGTSKKDTQMDSGGFYKGMVVFTITKGGLMYEAVIAGQKFKYTPGGSK
jgi:hypothetical protein